MVGSVVLEEGRTGSQSDHGGLSEPSFACYGTWQVGLGGEWVPPGGTRASRVPGNGARGGTSPVFGALRALCRVLSLRTWGLFGAGGLQGTASRGPTGNRLNLF